MITGLDLFWAIGIPIALVFAVLVAACQALERVANALEALAKEKE